MSYREPSPEISRGFWIAIALAVFSLAILFLFLTLVTQNPDYKTPHESIWKTAYNLLNYLFWGIGFSQWLYIIPLALWLRHRRQYERMKGLLSGAAFIGLFCGGCFVIVFPSFFNYFILR